MVDRVVFHIGTPKTGSTAIQLALADAQESLLAQGVLYPNASRKGPVHVPIHGVSLDWSSPVISMESDALLLDETRASGASTLVLSSEFLTFWRSSRAVEWARALCEELSPRRVSVLGYVRPQWEYIESLYTQLVKIGGTSMPFDEYLEDSLAADSRFDPLAAFGPWREAFGEQFEVRAYDVEALVGRSVVDDFWHALDLGPPPRLRRRDVNRRPGAITGEMLRALHAILADYHLDGLLAVPSPPVSGPGAAMALDHYIDGLAKMANAFNRAQKWIEAELPEDVGSSRLTPDDLTRVVERFSASNEELVCDYLGGRNGGLFSPPSDLEGEGRTWSPSEASERERRVFADVAGRMLRTLSGGDTLTSGEQALARTETPAAPSPRVGVRPEDGAPDLKERFKHPAQLARKRNGRLRETCEKLHQTRERGLFAAVFGRSLERRLRRCARRAVVTLRSGSRRIRRREG